MNYNDYIKNIRNIFIQENIEYDEEQLKKVLEYALDKYKGKEILGEKTIVFVTEVAKEVATLHLDDKSVYAAILYPVVDVDDNNERKPEDVEKEIEDISKELEDLAGEETKELVINLKKLEENYQPENRLDIKINPETLRNMFVAIADNIRVVIIKIAERLSYMRRMGQLSQTEKEQVATECLEIYAPIAHRLGMSKVKSELEDISFRILYPDEYHKIKEQIDEKKAEREAYIEARINELSQVLKDQNIEATIYGRPKHFFSIYKKMKAKSCNADDLFDLIAIRVIVNSVKDCYNVLGIVHDMYKPMPGRFKDYIAVPKTNMYQSLHTTVFGEGGRPFEIQIRTWNMHNVAERGIAAHFSYKEKSKKISESDEKIMKIRKSIELPKDFAENVEKLIDSKEIEELEKVKRELLGEEVFVFTPKGDIKSMPRGSTPIDFAYSIHQKVAEQMVGAKINGRMVPLNTQLKNKDVVEVVTSKSSKGPNRDWLRYVKTTSARNKITSFLKKEGREINIQSGKDAFEKELRKQRYTKEELLKEEFLEPALKRFNCKTLDDCYENIGFGSISPVKVINKIVELYEESIEPSENVKEYNLPKKKKINSNELVEVEGIDNCLVKFAKCCSPIPGDDIVGYITYANGISIHRKDCPNLKSLDVSARTINVKWKSNYSEFTTKLVIMANYRDGIFSEVDRTLHDMKISILNAESKVSMVNRDCTISRKIVVKDLESLQKAIKALKRIDSVFYVGRDNDDKSNKN